MNAQDTLNALMAAGRVSPKDLIAVQGASKEMQELVDVVHAIFSTPESGAIYMREAQMVGTWEADEHRYWIDATLGIMQFLGTDGVEETKRAIGKIGAATRTLSQEEISVLSSLRESVTRTEFISKVVLRVRDSSSSKR